MVRRDEEWDFISDAFHPDWVGGLQRYASEFAQVVADSGRSTRIWTRMWSPSGAASISEIVPDAKVVQLLPNVRGKLRGLLLTALSLVSFPMHARLRGSVRVAHTSILGNLFFSRRSKALQVYVFHASPALELATQAKQSLSFNMGTRLRVGILGYLEASCLKKADCVVVLSDFSKQLLLQQYSWMRRENVHVIPGGSKVSGIEIAPRTRESAKRLIALRRLEWRTGVDLLLEGFAGSGIASDGWELDVVGTGSLTAELKLKAVELGIDKKVTFHGLVSEEAKSALLSRAQLFVLPTRAFEGFGLATIEAMALGLVPIVTSAGASPEIVSDVHSELVCEPTAHGLAGALRLWTSDERQAQIDRISARSADAAAEYDWGRVLERYLKLVDEYRK
ncbi:glycosyltransferase family 4 protein [Arthrobacter globiformis]|uniref:glycosyltransferase family 4 protein n=1 Tax=Arthrobacter globiformis TaxID=1665 RepID=UPI0027945046|nr:glycosyltransferase family 4 protein [Arthrobacter globiformis]MDQ0620114.1 glycosyltransferase involved in cell wall biosynthesis [Arthrobacter globiformis]